ncbi:MAG: putative Zn-dependent hydrolases of the beta-lactamase fold [Rhodobacteraceae bacterium HLUCCA12]|nr:MAG: putative Zn-dependent hydrolases of the beta-lactamase fold [Rhodobacteraceae bacterium HLUCCA12]
MKITQIRNATLRLDFGGVRFLIDPMLGEQGAYPPFSGTPNEHLRNPMVPLVTPMSEILDVDAVIVTHLHADHWDAAAAEKIDKDTPIFTQNAADAAKIAEAGFTDTRVLGADTVFNGITMTRTAGQHGSDEAIAKLGDRLGQVCGVVFRHPEEKVLYLAGDTIWNDHVAGALTSHRPEVVIVNAGAALIHAVGHIIMGTEDVLAVHCAAPNARIIASHMEALNHCTLSRAELRDFAGQHGFANALDVPDDGAVVEA